MRDCFMLYCELFNRLGFSASKDNPAGGNLKAKEDRETCGKPPGKITFPTSLTFTNGMVTLKKGPFRYSI